MRRVRAALGGSKLIYSPRGDYAEGYISRLHLSSFPVPVEILKRPPLMPAPN